MDQLLKVNYHQRMEAKEVLTTLRKHYNPPRTFLEWETPFDLLIATLLSAQCTDAMVIKVTRKLFQKYRTPKDYLSVPRKELEQDIRSCGTYRNKAKYIQETSAMLIENYNGEVPQSIEELIKLPGIGRKTAAIVMWAAFGKNEGIAVDTHVERLAKRMGLSKKKTADKIELDLMESVPMKQWGELTTLIISHGRAVCTARNRKCDECVFQKECPSSSVKGRTDLAKK